MIYAGNGNGVGGGTDIRSVVKCENGEATSDGKWQSFYTTRERRSKKKKKEESGKEWTELRRSHSSSFPFALSRAAQEPFPSKSNSKLYPKLTHTFFISIAYSTINHRLTFIGRLTSTAILYEYTPALTNTHTRSHTTNTNWHLQSIEHNSIGHERTCGYMQEYIYNI